MSNKLTFSLTLVVMLAFGLMFVATPADAQKVYVSQVIDTPATNFPKANGFAIFEMNGVTDANRQGANGIVGTTAAGIAAADGAKSDTATPIVTAAVEP